MSYSVASDVSAGFRVLVVEDEPDISALVVFHLAKAGYRVSTATNGPEAISAASAQEPSLVILDLMLPGISGFEVLAQFRASEAMRHVAVLMLSARRSESDRIKGLTLGADDYMTKPFSPQELVLRVGAILRRTSAPVRTSQYDLQVGPIQIDQAAVRVAVDGLEIDLTPIEYRLLMLLAERRGRVQGRQQLLDAVWSAAPDLQTRTVDMHIQRLRGKLGAAGDLIETVRGFGYRLRPVERSNGA